MRSLSEPEHCFTVSLCHTFTTTPFGAQKGTENREATAPNGWCLIAGRQLGQGLPSRLPVVLFPRGAAIRVDIPARHRDPGR